MFSKPVKPQAPVAATIKGLCQAAHSDIILHTEKGKNTSLQRSGNLHEPSQTDTAQRPPERQEKMGTGGSLDKKGLFRSYVQERSLARWGPGLFSEELRSLQRKLDVTRVVSFRVFQ